MRALNICKKVFKQLRKEGCIATLHCRGDLLTVKQKILDRVNKNQKEFGVFSTVQDLSHYKKTGIFNIYVIPATDKAYKKTTYKLSEQQAIYKWEIGSKAITVYEDDATFKKFNAEGAVPGTIIDVPTFNLDN